MDSKNKIKNNIRNQSQKQILSSTLNKKTTIISKSKPHKNKSKVKDVRKNYNSPHTYQIKTQNNTQGFYPLLQTILKLLISKSSSAPTYNSQKISQMAQERSILQQLLTSVEKQYKIGQIHSQKPQDKYQMVNFLHQEQNKLTTLLKVCCARAKLQNMDVDDWREQIIRLYGYVMYEDRNKVNQKKQAGYDLLKEIYNRFDELNMVTNQLFRTLQKLYMEQKSERSETLQQISFQQISSTLFKVRNNSQQREQKPSKHILEQQNMKLIRQLENIEEQFEQLVEDKLHLQERLRRQQLKGSQLKQQINDFKVTIKQLQHSNRQKIQQQVQTERQPQQPSKINLQKIKTIHTQIICIKQQLQSFQYQQIQSIRQQMQTMFIKLNDCIEHSYNQYNLIHKHSLSLSQTRYVQQIDSLYKTIQQQQITISQKQLQINKYLKMLHQLKNSQQKENIMSSQFNSNFNQLLIIPKNSVQMLQIQRKINNQQEEQEIYKQGRIKQYIQEQQNYSLFKNNESIKTNQLIGNQKVQKLQDVGSTDIILADSKVQNIINANINASTQTQNIQKYNIQIQTQQVEKQTIQTNTQQNQFQQQFIQTQPNQQKITCEKQTFCAILPVTNQISTQFMIQTHNLSTETTQLQKMYQSIDCYIQTQSSTQSDNQQQMIMLKKQIDYYKNQLETNKQGYNHEKQIMIEESVMMLQRKDHQIDSYKQNIDRLKMSNEDNLAHHLQKQQKLQQNQYKKQLKVKNLKRLLISISQMHQQVRLIKQQLTKINYCQFQQLIFQQVILIYKYCLENYKNCSKLKKYSQIISVNLNPLLEQVFTSTSVNTSHNYCNNNVSIQIQTSQYISQSQSQQQNYLQETYNHNISPCQLLDLSSSFFNTQCYSLRKQNEYLRKLNKKLQNQIYRQLIHKGHIIVQQNDQDVQQLFMFVNSNRQTYQGIDFNSLDSCASNDDEKIRKSLYAINSPKKIQQKIYLAQTVQAKPKQSLKILGEVVQERQNENKQNQGVNDIQIQKIFDF